MFHPIYVCYYIATEPKVHQTWCLTHDKNLAQAIDSNCQLATLFEVYEWGGIGGQLPNRVKVIEGDYIWREEIEDDGYGDKELICEYVGI